jgi:hypothetical protein
MIAYPVYRRVPQPRSTDSILTPDRLGGCYTSYKINFI